MQRETRQLSLPHSYCKTAYRLLYRKYDDIGLGLTYERYPGFNSVLPKAIPSFILF